MALVSTILLVIYSVPLCVKYKIIHEHKIECIENVKLRNEHLQQSVDLQFMGVHLGDAYSDVVTKMKNDTNVLKLVDTDIVEPQRHVELFDAAGYEKEYQVNTKSSFLTFDKQLGYDVFFDNDTVRLNILFFGNKVHYLSVGKINPALYSQKYGKPECYYIVSPQEMVCRSDNYPFFYKQNEFSDRHYSYKMFHKYNCLVQWTFNSGVIRMGDSTVYYIANGVFDSIRVAEDRVKKKMKKNVLLMNKKLEKKK